MRPADHKRAGRYTHTLTGETRLPPVSANRQPPLITRRHGAKGGQPVLVPWADNALPTPPTPACLLLATGASFLPSRIRGISLTAFSSRDKSHWIVFSFLGFLLGHVTRVRRQREVAINRTVSRVRCLDLSSFLLALLYRGDITLLTLRIVVTSRY